MHKPLRLPCSTSILPALVLTLVAGCQSTATYSPSAEPDAETSTGNDVINSVPDRNAEATRQPQQQKTAVAVRDRHDELNELPAVAHLLDQAEVSKAEGLVSQAEQLANRALSIDRRAARAYLILAELFKQRDRRAEATNFARKGLLYISEQTLVGQRLAEILAASPNE